MKNEENKALRYYINNIISGFAKLSDGLLIILSLGNYNSDLSYQWAKYRLKNFKQFKG